MRTCNACGKPYKPTGRNQKYCSYTCSAPIRVARSRAYYDKHYRTGTGSGGNQQGANNHQWKGGASPYFYQRKKLDSLASPACERCGTDLSKYVRNANNRGYWTVHHKDHNTSNNDLGNLELLCKRCHQVEHRCWENFTS